MTTLSENLPLRRRTGAAVGAAILAALALRFADLGRLPLWCDELATVQRLGLRFADHVRAMKGNHPLYEILLRLWAGPDSGDVWVRIPSAALGVLAVWLAWLLARKAGRAEGALAAWLMALSPLHVMYSRIARAYSLATVLALAGNLFFLAALRRRTAWSYAAYALSIAAMIYSNLVAGSVWMAQGVFLLWFFRRRLKRLLPWIAAHGAVGLLILPWMWFSFRSAAEWGGETTYTAQQQGRLVKVGYQALTFCLGETVNPLNWRVVPIAAVAFGAVLALGALRAARHRSGMACFFLAQVAVVYGLGLFFGAAAPKHLAVILPAWLGLAAIGLRRRGADALRVVLAILIFLTTAASLLNYYTGREFADADMVTPWREMTAAIRNVERPGEGLFIGYRMDRGAYDMFQRYYRGGLTPQYLDFHDWRASLSQALRKHARLFLLLHDGDPWKEIARWLDEQGVSVTLVPFQLEEHTLQRLREGGLFADPARYRSYLYRLYVVERP